MYIRINPITGNEEFSSCETLILIYNHPDMGLISGQRVSNPSEELIGAEGWMIYTPPIPEPYKKNQPYLDDIINALSSLFNVKDTIVVLDDNSAVTVKALFTPWITMLEKQKNKASTDPDVVLHKDERYFYNDNLFKVLLDHTPQDSWNPEDAHSLFVKIAIEDGTKEHPIHFSQGMIIESNKYYTQFDIEYKCIRDSIVGIYADLKDLVGNYVEIVE